MNTKQILLINHAHREGRFRGPADVIVENLSSLECPFFLIEHDLCGKGESLLIKYGESGNKEILHCLSRSTRSVIFRYIGDALATFRLSMIVNSSQDIDLVIAINPLNALVGLILRTCGMCRRIIFISADYTKNRFGNPILDSLYCALDKFVCLHADITGSVSTRIQKLRSTFGLSDKRNYFFPNTPPASIFDSVKMASKTRSRIPPVLVSVGSLSDQLSYSTMFDAVLVLRDSFPAIHLNIIGGGERELELKQIVKEKGLVDSISFLGRLSHADTLQKVSESSIGLALYSGKWSFNFYGDSMKIREYVGLGLPVITTDTHSTVDDIVLFSSGLVVEDTPQKLASAITRILEPSQYLNYQDGALKMAGKYETVYKDFFRRFLDQT